MVRCWKKQFLYVTLLVIFTMTPSILATARFTHFPPSLLYVSSGGTAKFVWDFHVDNRLGEFKTESPVWYFINQATLNESIIGTDNRVNNWSFLINREACPPRLLNPDRVSREPTATLVITNVTNADNGKYRCRLQLKAGNPIGHQVQLVVTVRPTFLTSHPENAYQIIESQTLKINCTAIGPPTPNITMVNITDGMVVVKKEGSAVLHIDNIRRYHAGVYECQAKNSPNEDATTTRTNVTVYYPPSIDITATPDVVGCIGRKVQLVCKANGVPKPSMTLKDSRGKVLSSKTDSGEISHSIDVKDSSQFDNYTCIAENKLANASHVISLKEQSACPPPTPKPGTGSKVPAGIIAGVVIAGILAIAGLVIALIFCYRKKKLERDSRTSGVRQERAVRMSSLPDQDEQYASVQHQQERKGATAQPIPQYAQVDKSKKKKHNPDGLVYADLDLNSKDEYESSPISIATRHPTKKDSTVYAGIRQHQPEPQYSNLQGRDVSI